MEEIILAKCPECGETLEVHYAERTFFFEDTWVEVTIIGNCPNNCHKKFKWTEIFEYVEHRDVTYFD